MYTRIMHTRVIYYLFQGEAIKDFPTDVDIGPAGSTYFRYRYQEMDAH